MHLRPVVVGGTRPSDSPQDGADTSKGLTRPGWMGMVRP